MEVGLVSEVGVELAEDGDAAEAGDDAVAVLAAGLGEREELDRHAQAGLRGSSSRSSRKGSGSRPVRSRGSAASSIAASGIWWMAGSDMGKSSGFGWREDARISVVLRDWAVERAVGWGGCSGGEERVGMARRQRFS